VLSIKIIAVGRLREKHYIDACNEYIRRMGAYYKTELVEVSENRLGAAPGPGEIQAALLAEGKVVLDLVPPQSLIVAMCVEGREYSSEGFAEMIKTAAIDGRSRICFIIGSSYGLHDTVKAAADLRMSMSKMTLPHHLARVVLLEQLYRAGNIISGGKYNK
jgi:23S rRNA (pseudouridine1915-N3)-methyltransferase